MRLVVCSAIALFAALDATPRGDDPRCRGHVWIVDQEAGKVLPVHRTQGVLREIGGFTKPRDFDLLPNGHVVVAGLDCRVVEVDLKGNVVWTYQHSEGLYSIRGLKSGNLLVGTFTKLIEVDRTGKVVWEFDPKGKPQDVVVLPNGNYLVAIYNKTVLEIGKHSGRISEHAIPNLIMSVQPLPKGAFLVAELGGARISEWDASGKLVRTINVGSPVPSAYRTRSGGTLISTWTRVYEIDDKEKVVWEGPPVKKCSRLREY